VSGESQTTILFYREGNHVPALDWMEGLPRATRERLRVTLDLLARRGYRLDRPYSAPLGDGVHELRVDDNRVHYRLLYFWHGPALVILSHGLKKERRVPPLEIERAKANRESIHRSAGEHVAEVEL
jgi:phage-related protein